MDSQTSDRNYLAIMASLVHFKDTDWSIQHKWECHFSNGVLCFSIWLSVSLPPRRHTFTQIQTKHPIPAGFGRELVLHPWTGCQLIADPRHMKIKKDNHSHSQSHRVDLVTSSPIPANAWLVGGEQGSRATQMRADHTDSRTEKVPGPPRRVWSNNPFNIRSNLSKFGIHQTCWWCQLTPCQNKSMQIL